MIDTWIKVVSDSVLYFSDHEVPPKKGLCIKNPTTCISCIFINHESVNGVCNFYSGVYNCKSRICKSFGKYGML